MRARLAIPLIASLVLLGGLSFYLLWTEERAVREPSASPKEKPSEADSAPVPDGPEKKAVSEEQAGSAQEPAAAIIDSGSSVSGRVRDISGRPIRGALVRPRVSADTVDQRDRALAAALKLRAETDAQGRYRLEGLPPRRDYLIEASHPDYAPAWSEDLTLSAGESLEGVELVLLRGGEIAGRVMDEEGSGIAGAGLWLDPTAQAEGDTAPLLRFLSETSDGEPILKTGADGSYRLTHLPPGAYRVRARDPSSTRLAGSREGVEVADGESVEEMDIVLATGEALSGRVVDTDGKPVEGAEVSASGSEESSSQARSDADGRFKVTGLLPGAAHIKVLREGYSTAIEEAVVPGEDAVFTLVPTGSIEGKIQGSGGEVFPTFQIRVQIRRPDGDEELSIIGFDNESGTFEIEGEPGTYVLTAWVPGFAPSESGEIIVSPRRKTQGVVISLQKGETLRGRVIVRGSGAPVEGASVYAGNAGEAKVSRDAESMSTKSGPDGSFALEGVPKGRVDLEATHPRYVRAELKGIQVQAGKVTEATLELREGGSLRGTVLRGDKPASGARIFYQRGGDPMRSVLTDSEGRFEVKGLEDGNYTLRTMSGPPSGRRRLRTEVVVKDGQVTEVELQEDDGSSK